jgi:hypothetical protein
MRALIGACPVQDVVHSKEEATTTPTGEILFGWIISAKLVLYRTITYQLHIIKIEL